MAKYRSLINWHDLQDDNHVYLVGDEYPRKGLTPTKDRIEQLCGTANLAKKPYIIKIEEKKPAKKKPKEKE